jgi:hypothetical protein
MDIQSQPSATCELTHRPRVSGRYGVAGNEPSHIHIPRPSRLAGGQNEYAPYDVQACCSKLE